MSVEGRNKMSNEDNNSYSIHTINLSKAWLTPRHRRTDRVVNMIKEFAIRHMKSESIKIDQDLNRHLWEKGKRNPPRKIRVKLIKDDDEVVVSYYEDKSKTPNMPEQVQDNTKSK
jgi:large subunit ribosomal protein L31e